MTALSRGDRSAALDLAADPRVRVLPRPVRATIFSTARPSSAIRWLVSLIAGAALVGPATIVRFGPRRDAPYSVLVAIPGRVIPAAELPPVEPLAIRSLDPDDARAYNSAVPFSADPNPAARPFRSAGAADDLARATDCLAAAAYYEAGDDPAGERAVAQVVLNRVRHPAFPKTVCGVVFQGSERTTGCQFTFACDGALVRNTPTPESWSRARAIATAALAGTVDRDVGYATHYHTDWVVPYWQASLDKIVAVHTQLFYRWTGWWGTPPAFNRRAEAAEPAIAALGRLSEAHRIATAAPAGIPLPGVPDDGAGAAPDPVVVGRALGQFLVTLPAGMAPARWPEFANGLCGTRPQCMVMAWRNKASTGTTLPLELTQIASMDFSYLRNRAAGLERTLWNCRETRRPDPHQCMKRQILPPGLPRPGMGADPVAADPNVGTGATTGPADLSGIHRKPIPDPAPRPLARPAPAPAPDPKTSRTEGRSAPVTPPGTSPAATP